MKEATRQQIETHVFDFYIEHGDALTIPEISNAIEYGETTVRKAIQESSQLELTTKYIKILSRDEPSNPRKPLHQRRTVDAYVPTRRWMRDTIIRLKSRKPVGYSHGIQ